MLTALFIVISLLLVLACGVFVAAEIGMITSDRAAVERAAAEGDAKAGKVLTMLKHLSTQLSGSQLGITLTNLIIGFLAEPAISSLLEGPLLALGVSEGAVPTISVLIGLLTATVVTMVFGEMVPKNLAIAQPLKTARAVAGYQLAFTRFFGWALRILNGSANGILRKLGIEPTEELESARNTLELASLVRRSAEQGTLESGTAYILERSLRFGGRIARDVLTPRVRVRTVDFDDSVAEVVTLSRRTGHSCFPVVRNGRLDDVVGIVHITSAIAVPREERWQVRVEAVMSEPVLVPDSLSLDPLTSRLRGAGLPLAVVIDEYGGAAGIVSVEDLLEEIVGDVWDEHDPDRDPDEAQADGSWVVSALLRPDEVTDITGLEIPENETLYETLAGLLAESLGRVPRIGDTTTIEGVMMRIERMDGRRVDRVRLWTDEVVSA
jgi:hypothetical protein